MARILVTGGAGYVGSVCCLQLLERGHRVTVVDDLSTGHARAVPQGALLQQLNIGDRYALAAVLSSVNKKNLDPMLQAVLTSSRAGPDARRDEGQRAAPSLCPHRRIP